MGNQKKLTFFAVSTILMLVAIGLVIPDCGYSAVKKRRTVKRVRAPEKSVTNFCTLQDGIIMIQLESNQMLTFTNPSSEALRNEEEDSDLVHYMIGDYIAAINSVTVIASVSNDNWTILVNRKTGGTLNLWGYPIISPDRHWLCDVSMNASLDIPKPNAIRVYRIDGPQPVRAFYREIKAWHPLEVRWENNGSILVKTVKLNQGNLVQGSEVFLRLYGKTWNLELN